MKKPTVVFLILFFSVIMAFSQEMEAYKLYNSKGKDTDYGKMLKKAAEADVVLFGELHNNPICHWLQLELSRSLYAMKKQDLIMGAEMFEADNSLLISEYLKGLVKDKNFESEARLWPNYKTDYKPLLQFARDSSLVFVATNIPRRYASMVNRGGFEALEALGDEARSYIAPLPVPYDPELPGYKSMLEMMEGSGGHGNDNLPKAQAIKDATMAHSISRNISTGKLFLHFHGTYHSDNYEGIVWYLKQYKPDLKIVTISSCEQVNIDNLAEENNEKADFILVVPERMTKTH